jgi:hypothetical protein
VILRVFRPFVALLLALALFAPGSAFGRVLYACSMSGKVSAGRCCCHGAEAKKAADKARAAEPPKAERPGCCEMQDHRRATIGGASNATDVQVLAAASTGLLPAVEPAQKAGAVLRPHPHAARGPPGSAVYVVNCSLLI